MMINGESYLSEKELSSVFGISVGWIRKQRYQGKLPYHKLCKKVFFNEQEVASWLKANLKAY